MAPEETQEKPQDRRCPLCGERYDSDLEEVHSIAEAWVIEQIKRAHPDWVESDGGCTKCVELYRKL